MVEFKRILCPIDLSDLSSRPLAYAGAIARWYDGRATVLHVVPTFDPMEVPPAALFDPVRFAYPVPRETVLEELRKTAVAAGIGDATVVAEAGDAATTIVDQSAGMNAELVVMGTHGRRGYDRLLLGSVTEKVLRRAPCPVLTVPPHAAGSPGFGLRTILCPIDFSSSALQAFGFALDLARRAHASVILLHVIEWLAEEEPRELGHFNVPEFRQHLTHDMQERLEALVAQEPRVSRGVRSVVVRGRAHREILRISTEEAVDFIVMGAQGRGGPALALLGSTTQQVVRGVACPVLTVRGPAGSA